MFARLSAAWASANLYCTFESALSSVQSIYSVMNICLDKQGETSESGGLSVQLRERFINNEFSI